METPNVVNAFYYDSKDPIKCGDLISVSGRPGRVDEVLMQGSEEAKSCCCEDTGALAVTFDDGIRVLLPFGVRAEILKRKDATQL